MRRRSRYQYIERFKLCLADDSSHSQAPELPEELTPVQVVADFLGLLRRYVGGS